ncbi:MAG: type II secretion system protein [Gammaproteobacteria bacterium]|nr:type II secretion system protein [Gammaproteobacteria bacterium]
MSGFTLLEMVITILLIGIVAGILAPFYQQAGSMFTDTRIRTELTAKGRLALERLSRELREAHPGQIQATANSLRFLQLEDLLSVSMLGSVPEKEYRACTPISVNHLGSVLDWDIDDDGASDALLVDGVAAVDFAYAPGSTQRSAVVSMDLSLSEGDQSIRLFREVHIRNSQGTISCP